MRSKPFKGFPGFPSSVVVKKVGIAFCLRAHWFLKIAEGYYTWRLMLAKGNPVNGYMYRLPFTITSKMNHVRIKGRVTDCEGLLKPVRLRPTIISSKPTRP